jgi:hypothetical protein
MKKTTIKKAKRKNDTGIRKIENEKFITTLRKTGRSVYAAQITKAA